MSEDVITKEKINADSGPSVSRKWKTLLSAPLLGLWIVFMLMVWVLCKLLMPTKLDRFFMLFHHGCCRIFSLRYRVEGTLSQHRPTLFLSNHISYIDIFVLGAVIPGYFIAKSEVAGWPILGWLAKVQNTLFFERNSRKVHGQLQVMSEHFERQGNLILFPEGTSTEGEHVEPFKSSLLQAIEKAEATVSIQPVTIAYTHYQNKPMTRTLRDHYAWYGTMPFASHFFSALGLASCQVVVKFHPPITLDQFATRKDCANHCWQLVSDGLQAALPAPAEESKP